MSTLRLKPPPTCVRRGLQAESALAAAERGATGGAAGGASAGGSIDLLSYIDAEELQRRQERQQRFNAGGQQPAAKVGLQAPASRRAGRGSQAEGEQGTALLPRLPAPMYPVHSQALPCAQSQAQLLPASVRRCA